MKETELKNWTNIEQCKSLLFFTQLLEELLFDYTHSTYKPSIMNSPLLCREAIKSINEIEKGSINPANKDHIIEELAKSLKEDKIARILLGSQLGAILDELHIKDNKLKDLKTTLELIQISLDVSAYESHIYDEIKSSITSEYDPVRIRKISRQLVTHLISKGVSKDFINEKAKNFFHSSDIEIKENNQISDFISLLPRTRENYDVYFIIDNSLKHALQFFGKFDIEILSSAPEHISTEPFFNEKKQRSLAVVKKIKAFDYYSARNIAEYGLKFASTLLSLYHHKQDAAWSNKSIVISESGSVHSIKSSINPMHRCKDLRPLVASTKIEKFMSEFNMKRDSFSKFIRSAQLHSMALRTKDIENQILNLWIALESLIPDETKDEKSSTIQHIVASITPFLNINYIEGLIKNLVKDMIRWNYNESKVFLNGTNEDDYTKSLYLLMSQKEHSNDAEIFYQKTSTYPLLQDRFDYIRKLVTSPERLSIALKNHEERIEWQIRRIYRTRNIIVHTGTTPSNAEILVEHTHDYLDTVLNLLVKLASKPVRIMSVSQGFKFIQIEYSMKKKKLSKIRESSNSEEIKKIIFSE